MDRTKTQVDQHTESRPPSTQDIAQTTPAQQHTPLATAKLSKSTQTHISPTAVINPQPSSAINSCGPLCAQRSVALQGQVGNLRTAQMASNDIQRKIPVSKPDDESEKQAEEAATRVVSGQKVAKIARAKNSHITNPIQKQAPEEEEETTEEAAPPETPEGSIATQNEEEEEEISKLQRIHCQSHDDKTLAPNVYAKSNNRREINDAGAEGRLNTAGSGRPLPEGIKTEMESGLGADFSGVRVHDTVEDRTAAHSLNAKAFAYRNHVWLGPNASAGDRKLMAHELTHVVQQGAAVSKKSEASTTCR